MTFIIDAAEQVPKFDLKAVCGSDSTNACFRGETQARDALAQQWAQFPAADRARCVQLTTMSKMPSYVQVITCLEMAQNARQLPPEEQTPSSSQSKDKPKRR
jgi:hypothetical protein